jgi:glutathione S-transferase
LEILQKQAKKPKFVFGYWGIRGLGAPARMMLEYSNASYVDTRYGAPDTPDWFAADKPKLIQENALINLPYVTLNDKTVTQSNAVYQFIGKKLNLNGRGDDSQTANEEVLCQAMDLRNDVVKLVYGDKGKFQAEMKKHLTEGSGPTNYTKFEGYLKQRGTHSSVEISLALETSMFGKCLISTR